MVHDVIKAISSDMAYIRRHYPSSLVIAGVFERCLRIAIDAHYRQAEDLAVENARNLPWAAKWLEEHGIPNVAMGDADARLDRVHALCKRRGNIDWSEPHPRMLQSKSAMMLTAPSSCTRIMHPAHAP